MRLCIAAFPLQLATTQGFATYQDQCRAWKSEFGADQRVTETTGFPLRPGTAPVCSGECYACGMTGHGRHSCTAPEHQQLLPRERAWRAICGSILGHNRTAPAARINLVGTAEDEDEFAWMLTTGAESGRRQGNEWGPSA